MLVLNNIRNNPDAIKEKLAVKNFKQLELVDELLALDKNRRALVAQYDETKSKINASSKEIGDLMKQGNKAGAEELKTNVANWKAALEPIDAKLSEADKSLKEILYLLPNTPSTLVPTGTSAADNVVVKEAGTIPTLASHSQPHWELCKQYNLIQFEWGNKITGSGFPVYVGAGARLQRALINYFLQFNAAAGYTEVIPPFMVNEDSAFGTGQLPDKEGQMYHATADNFYLIPTSEVPVTNIYRDEIVKQTELPIKLTAYSPCFRREAGSYGSDVRGLNRLHQFDKVEIVQLVEQENSYDTLNQMVDHVEALIKNLELPYRILRLCGGDMSFASALTYDFEVYSAAQQKWLEVSSVSNFETFQTNRLQARYKNNEGKIQLLHSLNGSSLALPRIMAALLENFQTENGINLPKALEPFFGGTRLV
jgi:seryl-tRNA synthetase